MLQDAESSRYKSALHSTAFDKAVKNYRQKHTQQFNKSSHLRLHEARLQSNISQPPTAESSVQNDQVNFTGSPIQLSPPSERNVEEVEAAAQAALEQLPLKVIQQARAFRDYLQHFMEHGEVMDDEEDDNSTSLRIPPETTEILDEMAQAEGIGERLKREILQDDEARNVCALFLRLDVAAYILFAYLDAFHAEHRE